MDAITSQWKQVLAYDDYHEERFSIGVQSTDITEDYEKLKGDYYNLQMEVSNLESSLRDYNFIVDQIWGNPTSEPIPEELKITSELASEIIKNMEAIR